MTQNSRFSGTTIQLFVPDFKAGVEFYSKLLGRSADFEPHHDFVEWEVFPGFWFQLAEGKPRPTYPIRFRVEDIEAECQRVERELEVVCSGVTRISGLVAFCNFTDRWGNNLGFYQRLFAEQPTAPGGSYREWEKNP